MVKLLLKKGANVMAECRSGMTPLSLAAANGHKEVVELLLGDVRINPDFRDVNGWTPLSAAALNGCEAVVTLLLADGRANPDSGDFSGRTPLSWAAGWRK